jgi:hypothetical protein
MRSSPHVQVAAAMSAISRWSSGGIRGRPPRLGVALQTRREGSRCQRTSVSGRTVANNSRHGMIGGAVVWLQLDWRGAHGTSVAPRPDSTGQDASCHCDCEQGAKWQEAGSGRRGFVTTPVLPAS